jgi:hypothetical protein
MSNQTAKSHKSQKVDGPAKPRFSRQAEGEPRQRKIAGVIAIPAEGSSLAVSPSSDSHATTASVPPVTQPAVEPTQTAVPTELPKEQQPWYRRPDSKLRGQAEKIAVMRAAGHKVDAIAKRLKTTEPNVRFVEYIARKNGWYDDEDNPVDVEAELAMNIDRKIVRNISASLDGQMTNWQTHEMTIKAAGGRGIFKNHDKVEGGQAAMTVVAIRVEMPAIGAGDQQVLDEASIGGIPAYSELTEGEILGEQEGMGSEEPRAVSPVATETQS